MNDFRPLGPPIRHEPIPVGETVARTTNPKVWIVDGKRQTWIPENEGANSSPAIDFYLSFLQDPEFPVAQWGSF